MNNTSQKKNWAVFYISHGRKFYITEILDLNHGATSFTSMHVKRKDPRVLLFTKDEALSIVKKNLRYDEKFGVTSNNGVERLWDGSKIRQNHSITDAIRKLESLD